MLNAGCRGVRELFGVPGQGLRMGQDLAPGWTKPSSSLKLPLLWPMAMWARCSPLGLWLLLVRSLPLDYVSTYLRLCMHIFAGFFSISQCWWAAGTSQVSGVGSGVSWRRSTKAARVLVAEFSRSERFEPWHQMSWVWCPATNSRGFWEMCACRCNISH